MSFFTGLHSRSADLYPLTACKGTVSTPTVDSPGQREPFASCELATAVILLLLLSDCQSNAVCYSKAVLAAGLYFQPTCIQGFICTPQLHSWAMDIVTDSAHHLQLCVPPLIQAAAHVNSFSCSSPHLSLAYCSCSDLVFASQPVACATQPSQDS